MEFLFFVTIIGLIIALVSRHKYKKRSELLDKEVKRLQSVINRINAEIAREREANNTAAQMADLAMKTQNQSQSQEQASTEVQPNVENNEAPVAQVANLDMANQVATAQSVSEVKPVTPVAPVAPIASETSVAKPAPAPQNVKTVVAPEPKKKKAKISAVAVSFAVGVLMLLISAAVFITATWNSLSAPVKTPILFGVVAVVWGFSYLTTKKFKIEKTGSALYILGSFLLPVAILGAAIANNLETGLITFSICSAALMITGFVGHKIFKSKFQVGISIFGLTWLVIFMSMKIFGETEGFILGFALVLVLFTAIFKLTDTKVFGVASEVAVYISSIVYIVAVVSSTGAVDMSEFIIYILSSVLIAGCMIVFTQRRSFAKYVVPFFVASGLPALTTAFFDYEETTGFIVAGIVFAIFYVTAYFASMKFMGIKNSLANALITIAAVITSLVCNARFDEAQFVTTGIITGISVLTAIYSYISSKSKAETVIYSIASAVAFDAMLLEFFTNALQAYGFVLAAIVIGLGIYRIFSKKLPWIYEGMSWVAPFVIIFNDIKNQDWFKFIPIVLIIGAAYFIRQNKTEKKAYSVLMAIFTMLSVLSICDGRSHVIVAYVLLGITLLAAIAKVVFDKTPYLYESFAIVSVITNIAIMTESNYWIMLSVVILLVSYYILRKSKFEKFVSGIAIGITSVLTLSYILVDYEEAFVLAALGLTIVALGVNIATKKLTFVYEGFALASIVGSIGTSVDNGLIKTIVITLLFATIPVCLFLRYKKSTTRDVFIAITGAIALSAAMTIVSEAVADYKWQWALLIDFIYIAVIYLATVFAEKFLKNNLLIVKVLKYMFVFELAIVDIIMVIESSNPDSVFGFAFVGIANAILAIATVYEKNNFGSFVPAFAIINVLEMEFARGGYSEWVVVIVGFGAILLFTTAGRFLRNKVFSKTGVDWLTVSAPFVISMYERFDVGSFAPLMIIAFYVMTFIGRFNKEGETIKTGYKHHIKGICSIALMFVGFAVATQDFFTYPMEFEIELRMLSIIIAAAIIAFVIKLGKAGKWTWFITVAAFVHIEALNALMEGTTAQLVIVGVLGIGLYFVSFAIKNKSWFALSIETIAGIGIYLAISYWNSTSWWIYLLVAGVLLIGTATYSEIKKRSTPELEDGTKASMFKEWKW